MSSEVFDDEMGQAIYARLMNYAIESSPKKPISNLSEHVKQTAKIVEITKETLIQTLKAESEVLIFKQTFGEEIPTLFISGVLHAIDVLEGNGSVMAR
jgi:methyltransferase-like protein